MRSVAKSVALSFLWVPAFAGMTARFANVSRRGEGTRSTRGLHVLHWPQRGATVQVQWKCVVSQRSPGVRRT